MTSSPSDRFRHDALFYSGSSDFLGGTVPFIRAGLDAGEPVLVVEPLEKINMLRSALGDEAERVLFADMAHVGANPARIIPAWQEFVDQQGTSGRHIRGIGEPIWKGRSPDELVECQRHEALLNAAFGNGRPWWLLCPYDSAQLPADVILEAQRSHEHVLVGDEAAPSQSFEAGSVSRAPLNSPFPDPRSEVRWGLRFGRDNLRLLRDFLLGDASTAGISASRAQDLIAAVNEIATNSVLHGGGGGIARVWFDTDRLVCEVRDRGSFDDPLADRQRPGRDLSARRGLWLANQLCDLVQVRSTRAGTAVRLHMLREQRPQLQVLQGQPAVN
jgi:anti-sigma regulatory factor (Ser/Thr protein kinase)